MHFVSGLSSSRSRGLDAKSGMLIWRFSLQPSQDESADPITANLGPYIDRFMIIALWYNKQVQRFDFLSVSPLIKSVFTRSIV